MREQAGVPLAGLTTLRLGGPARRLVEVDDESDLVDVVREADDRREPLLILGGGSNVVVADEGFDGTAVRITTSGQRVEVDSCSGAVLTVAAGEPWDDLVAQSVEEGWVGFEALSGIPGLVGATPIQNVGAYGQEIADTLARVRTYDRFERAVRTFSASECGFGYRTSRFKQEPGRHVVLDVAYQLPLGRMSATMRYAELARRLAVGIGDRAPAKEVREAVLALRRSKGMVLDPPDPDTVSAGSFFTNPILSVEAADKLPPAAPRFAQADGSVKTSAAWLIEQAGFGKGFGNGRARISSKHTLALTNADGATTSELISLAKEVRDGVRRRFGILLEPEPVLVGVSL